MARPNESDLPEKVLSRSYWAQIQPRIQQYALSDLPSQDIRIDDKASDWVIASFGMVTTVKGEQHPRQGPMNNVAIHWNIYAKNLS